MWRIMWPWTKRADEEARARREAEKRLHDVKSDWLEIDEHVRAVRREIALNDWTRTAKVVFGGRDKL